MSISYASAFIGGLVTILAPCAAMLIPAFFAYAFSSRTRLAARTFIFFLGLATALIPLGVAAGTLGFFLKTNQYLVTLISGIIIIILGIVLALGIPFPTIKIGTKKNRVSPGSVGVGNVGSGPFSQKKAKGQSDLGSNDNTVNSSKNVKTAQVVTSSENNAATPLAVFLLGISYGLAGAGCTGPILGAVLTVAANSGSAIQGGIILAIYALGMVTPVVILAFIWDVFDIGSKKFLRPKPIRFLGRDTTVGSLISGFLFIVLGIGLIWTGGLSSFSILDSAQQLSLETRIMELMNSIPNWVFMLLIICVVGLIVLAVTGKKESKPKKQTKASQSDDNV